MLVPRTERWTRIVHVIALDAFVHDTEAAAYHGFAVSTDVISKPNARTKGEPVIFH